MEVIKVGICLEDRAFGEALAVGLARGGRQHAFFSAGKGLRR